MRFADTLFRRGHLSEQALINVCLTGDRPAHIDRCDICAERADGLGRWLDETRELGLEDADRALPAERLAVQQRQILARIEQAERPARVISFPAFGRGRRLEGGRGIQPAWIAVAAAAGLVLGVVGGNTAHWIADHRGADNRSAAINDAVNAPVQTAGPNVPNVEEFLLGEAEPTRQFDSLQALDELTPRVSETASVQR